MLASRRVNDGFSRVAPSNFRSYRRSAEASGAFAGLVQDLVGCKRFRDTAFGTVSFNLV
jgi:hypothetical protein